MPLPPNVRVGAHVELFHEDERTGKKLLVHTSRPCKKCGEPLYGVVILEGGSQVHAICPEVRQRG